MACLVSNLNQADLGITDEEIDHAQTEESKIPDEVRKISVIVGEIFEETQIDCDQVDQMVALFLAITPEKVKHAQELENKALKNKRSMLPDKKQTIKKEIKKNSIDNEL